MTAALPSFNPYAALRRLQRQQWWQRCRQQPAQSLLHGAALTALLALVLPLLLQGAIALRPSLQLIWQRYPLIVLSLLAVLAAVQHGLALRRWHNTTRRHWLWPQPVAADTLRHEARRCLLWQGSAQALLILALATLSQGPGLLSALVLIFPAAALAAWIEPRLDRLSPRRRRAAARPTPFALRGRGSLWRWQWQQLGSTLAPGRLTPLWLVWLLMPRGPAILALVAAYLMLLLALLQGWRISLQLIPSAEIWLRSQPLPARRWLVQLCLLPGGLLLSGALAILLPAWINQQLAAALLALPVVLGFALLHLACTLAWRDQPARIGRQFAVQALLLVACVQTFPPLVPVLWLTQLGLLGRRALSAR
ncbi:hypothetical protein [Pseudomarimonas arenosa]|uniref:Uncharacterized protein n=1 Tax=Pseudomarimonas arenosa TaxID=2774145 RepID=A0AAW3ZSQ3_9GAMM|nr:hypothetical protein [Pseudomarimonas arenosa]MBD8527890.1 hypothetical protein [Pseudomarimonas arenosa]